MSPSLPRLGRTFFAWASALTVAACGLSARDGSPSRIMAALPEWESVGLSFVGPAGLWLALGEAALVLGAWSLARGRGALARLGGWVLVAWAALWYANGLRWLVAAPDGMSLAIFAALLVALLACLLATRAPRRALLDESA